VVAADDTPGEEALDHAAGDEFDEGGGQPHRKILRPASPALRILRSLKNPSLGFASVRIFVNGNEFFIFL
jgi:hypothetical protein